MVLFATAASETGSSQTDVDAPSTDTTSASAAAKAAQLLASMPACGVCCHENRKQIVYANNKQYSVTAFWVRSLLRHAS
jgi:hypothetical protein